MRRKEARAGTMALRYDRLAPPARAERGHEGWPRCACGRASIWSNRSLCRRSCHAPSVHRHRGAERDRRLAFFDARRPARRALDRRRRPITSPSASSATSTMPRPETSPRRSRVCAGRAFAVEIEGFDAFGGARPKSLFARVVPAPALIELQATQERLLRRLGAPLENASVHAACDPGAPAQRGDGPAHGRLVGDAGWRAQRLRGRSLRPDVLA